MAKIHFCYFDINTGYYPGFHHGLAYLIGSLKAEGHQVTLSHLTDNIDSTLDLVGQEKFDLLALSFTTNQKMHVYKFLNRIDRSERLIVAGGVHCTLAREKVFEELPSINAICIGEGEAAIKELCRRLDSGQDFVSIPSLYFKRNGGVVKNDIGALGSIDDLALPDYSLFDFERIISDGGGNFAMILGRGCPFDCSYCCNHAIRQVYPNEGKYLRLPTPQKAVNIIKNNLKLWPKTEKIAFADDTFTINKKWLLSFCELYKKEIGLPFLCNARVETINDEVVYNLKRAGCQSIDFGVESGSEWLRKHVLNRKHSNQEIKDAFYLTRKHGVRTGSSNIVGLPFETKEMAKDTLNLNIEIQPNYGKCFYFYPYPGTKLHEICLEYDLLLDKFDSVSGYLESPSLKGVFMSHKKMKHHFDLMGLFFYSQLLLFKINIPLLFKKLLLKVVFLIGKPILTFFDPLTSSRGLKKVRSTIRKVAMRYLR